MTLRILSTVMLFPGAALAGASASYTLEPLANAAGGESGGSANYSLTASTTPGGAGSSAAYTARTGFAGQLGFATGIALSAPALTVAEMQSIPLAAELSFDDGTAVALEESELAWSIVAGPLATLSTAGLATAAAVYQDTPATVRASSGGISGDLNLTVVDADPDNFSSYAADGLPDTWQVQHFGLNSPRGGTNGDFDDDAISNLFEFSNGTDPAGSGSGPGALRFSGGILLSPGMPVVDYAPAPNVLDHRVLFIRRKDAPRFVYGPQFSRNLAQWSNATTPLTVLADDGTFEVVSVRFPVLIGGRRSSSKFFRLNLTVSDP